jgi:hypothetical protein
VVAIAMSRIDWAFILLEGDMRAKELRQGDDQPIQARRIDMFASDERGAALCGNYRIVEWDQRRQREEIITLVEVIITVIAMAEAKTNGFGA